MGVIAHPDYAENNWVFMHYADPDEPKHGLARWEYKNDSLYEDTKVAVLEYPTQREECCHTGGGMVLDKDGNLFLECGSAWFKGNDNAQVKRVRFNAGNRPPVVKVSADKLAGELPLEVQLSSKGTLDYDENELTYSWSVTADKDFEQTQNEKYPTLTTT